MGAFEMVTQWLESLDLAQYVDPFRKQGYDSMNKIQSWPSSQRESKLEAAGCKPGTIVKLTKNIAILHAYGAGNFANTPGAISINKQKKSTSSTSNTSIKKNTRKIKEIRNNPMQDDFRPSKDDVNLTPEFTDSNGSSVSRSCQKILNGYVAQGMTPGEDCKFYLKSSRYNRYFLITVLYQD